MTTSQPSLSVFDAIVSEIERTNCASSRCRLCLSWWALGCLSKRQLEQLVESFGPLTLFQEAGVAFVLLEEAR
jgi:hypothetical protein